jgi:acylglycerol lipase
MISKNLTFLSPCTFQIYLADKTLTVLNIAWIPPLPVHKLPFYCWRRLVCRYTPLLAVIQLVACATPYVQPSRDDHTLPKITEHYALMEDGYRLPMSRWETAGNAHAVLLSLHGLNDYSHAFDNLGHYLASRGVTVIAYDQRGFGNTEGRGLWHGSDRMSADLATMARLLRKQYSGIPLYLLGESMGGAVVLTTLATTPVDVDGAVLAAPAVWSRSTMPYYQRIALWIGAHTFPGKRLTGEGLDIRPSDNTEMLQALAEDDTVIKATRIDVLYGISNLMDRAASVSHNGPGNILLLYGEHDDIIPAEPTCQLFENLSQNKTTRLSAVVYQQGYHMLTRDLQAEVVLEDIAAWIEDNVRSETHGSDMQSYCAMINGHD